MRNEPYVREYVCNTTIAINTNTITLLVVNVNVDYLLGLQWQKTKNKQTNKQTKRIISVSKDETTQDKERIKVETAAPVAKEEETLHTVRPSKKGTVNVWVEVEL